MAADAGFTTILQTVNVAGSVLSWNFSGLAGGTTYYFRVAASNANGTSLWSATLPATTSPVTVPAAPLNWTTSNNTQTSIRLNWVDNSNNETGFRVQIATNNTFTNNFQTFDVGPNVQSYTFTGLTRNTKYYFRVGAFNLAGVSPWPDAINDKTLR
jgi:titin